MVFVKLGGEADLSEHLRDGLIYLLPFPEREGIWEDRVSRMLPLDWRAPIIIDTGTGRNLYVSKSWLRTITPTEVVCSMDHWERRGAPVGKRWFYVLQIEDGVVKRATPDPERYMSDVIEQVAHLRGKLVDLYSPVERHDVKYIARKVY